MTVLAAVEAEARSHLLQLYFALCKHADPNVRHPAATVLKKVRSVVDDQDFKLGVNALVRELCRMTPAEVNAYRPVLDAALEHTALFGEYEWRDLADLAKRTIQQADVALQDYGLFLVERMAKIPSDHEEDLVHLLVGVARGAEPTQKERADKILRRMQLPDLRPNARHSLEEFLSPPKDSKEKEN